MSGREYVVPNGMAAAIWRNKYSRLKLDGRYQTWAERVTEVVDGNFLLDPRPPEQFQQELERTRELAVAGVFATSGRHLQHGDKDQASRKLELHSNCATAFTSFMLQRCLLAGAGVGRDYSAAVCRVDWARMPNVRLVLDEAHPDFHVDRFQGVLEPLRDARHKYASESESVRWFTVADTREGWSKITEILETAAWQERHADKLFIFDFSEVRERGAPIMGMQGRPASGPLPLMDAFAKIASIKHAGMAPWRQALFIDHYIAACVHFGGARRAARMAVKSWRDRDIIDFIDVKRGGFLWSANNSILVDADFWEQANSARHSHGRRVFEAAVNAAYFDSTGEPGFINIDKLNTNREGMDQITGENCVNPITYVDMHKRTRDMLDNMLEHVKKLEYPFLTNPCFSSGTLIITDKGAQPIEELVGKNVKIYDGMCWREIDNFRVTGRDQPMLKISFQDSSFLRVTPVHTMILENGDRIPAAELKVFDKVASVTDPSVIANVHPDKRMTVLSVEEDGIDAEVYCCTVQHTHSVTLANGVVTGQCGEVVLSTYGGLCVIGDICLAQAASLQEAKDAAGLMARFLVRVNRMKSDYAAEIARTNRIGVSLTGIHEFAWNMFGLTFRDMIGACSSEEHPRHKDTQEFWAFIDEMREHACQEATILSKELDMVVPHTVTCCKPSGTISKVMSCTEGAHLPALAYYLRFVQYQIDDPAVPDLVARGYPMEDIGHRYHNQVIVGFPTKQPIVDLMGDFVTTADETTPEENFRWLSLLEKHWLGADNANNMLSYTLKYDATKTSYDEFMALILKWQPKVRCVSIMPQSDWRESKKIYGYVPEQPITKEEYEEMMARITAPVEREAYSDDALSCASGVCPIESDR